MLVRGTAVASLLVQIERDEQTLVVVGSSGAGRLCGIVEGAVATEIIHRAPCSVLGARQVTDGFPRRIVVGVDGSEPSLAALRWALDEARLRGARVVAVYVWLFPSLAPRHGGIAPLGFEGLRRSAEGLLDEALEAVADSAEGVEVERVVVEGAPPERPVAVAGRAGRPVLGAGGPGGRAGPKKPGPAPPRGRRTGRRDPSGPGPGPEGGPSPAPSGPPLPAPGHRPAGVDGGPCG